MRPFKQTKSFLKILTAILISFMVYMPLSRASTFKNPQRRTKDTSDVYRYIRKALVKVSKSSDLQYIKTNIDSAESICRKEKIDFPSLLHLARAEYFFNTNDFKSASQEAGIALKKSKNNNETDVLVRTMRFLGKYCLRTEYFTESIDYYNNSILLAKKNRLKGIISGSYLGISEVYRKLGKLKEQRNALQMSIDAAITEKDTMYIDNGYYLLGTLYCGDSATNKDRDFHRADSILKRGLDISLAVRDTNIIASSLANLGWNFYLEKKYDQAIASYNQSLTYSIPSGKYGKFGNSANAYGNLGTIYRDVGETEESIKYYLKSIEQSQIGDDYYDLAWVYKDMSDMYLKKGDTSRAYETYVLFKKFSDSLLYTSNTRGLTDARIRYEADAHNKELELLSLRIKNQRILLYAYTGLFILSLAILILLLSRSRINTKRRISEMNRKISEITQANLRQQMNPHFIFNTLNSIQYYMYQNDKLATNNYLTKFSSLMRKVLENSQHTAIPLRDELDALNLYLELEMIRFKDKFDYKINIDDELDTLLYKVPTMLIQPYVENSICHGLMSCEIKGLIKVDLKLENEYIQCIIEDNGIGREAAHEKKKTNGPDHNSLGTQIITSRLDLVNALYGTSLKTIYTDLKDNTGNSTGTRVEIQIPILT